MTALLVALATAAFANPTAPEVVEVVERRAAGAPCDVRLDTVRLRSFPARTVPQLFGAAPGMTVTNHLGRGAAWNLSWRGHDAGHGRGFEVTVDGIPLNAPGHVQGDGYADTTYLPMGLVRGVDMCPSSARSDGGGYASAGSADLITGVGHQGWQAALHSASDVSGSIQIAFRPKGWGAKTYAFGEAEEGQGVGLDRRWRDVRLAGGIEGRLDDVHASLNLYLHDGAADVPPMLRAEDVANETVGFRESYRIWSGKTYSRRLHLVPRVTRAWLWGGVEATGWFGLQGFGIRDNQSGFLNDPDNGDGTETDQGSLDGGVRARFFGQFNVMNDITRIDTGLDLRATSHHQTQHKVDYLNARMGMNWQRRVGRLGFASWTRVSVGFFQRASLLGTIRFAGASDQRTELHLEGEPTTNRTTWMVEPEVTLLLTPVRAFQMQATWSRDNRAPDPKRDVPGVSGPTIFDTGDASVLVRAGPIVDIRVGAFGTWSPQDVILDRLDQRVLFMGPTRRLGGDAELSIRPYPGVRIGLDAAYADARLTNTGVPLPYVSRVRGSLGVYAERRRIGPILLDGALRFVYVAPRDLPNGERTGAMAYLDLTTAVEWRRWTFGLGLENLAPWNWTWEEFFTASHWNRQGTPDPNDVRHIVAGRPFALHVTVGGKF